MILVAIFRQWWLSNNIQRTNKKCENHGIWRWDVMTQSSRQVQMFPRNLPSPPAGETGTLKMGAAGFYETSVQVYNITKCHISADSNVHSNYCENIISHIMIHNKHTYINCFWHSEDCASWYILIIKTDEMHYFSNLFRYITLHVLDRFTVHHQESSTVHTATGICHTGYAVYSTRLLMMDSKPVQNM
jgi:hypothetical protein